MAASEQIANQTGSHRPLNILIAGAGIGGLTAALAFRRQGHNTTLFEQSRLANEIGAAINIAPNCNGILRRLGLYLEKHGAVDAAAFLLMDNNADVVTRIDRGDDRKTYGHPYHYMHRAHLHKGLKDLALSEEGAGKPSVLHTASRVGSVDVETATLTLENGEVFSGDLIIGADGIHSQTRSKIAGAQDITPFGSGMSGFRFLVDMQKLLDDPLTASLPGPRGSLLRLASVEEDHQSLVMYPCQNNEVMNCMLAVPTEVSGSAKGSTWRTETSKAQMLKVASSSYSAQARAVLDKAEPADIRLWELMDMATLPTWVTGKLALMGDAAHPFTPWRGQGGAMAIEDAASLGVMFPLGTTPEQIPERLELYQQCRRERAHFIQDLSRTNSPLQTSEHNSPKDTFDEFAAYGFDEWRHSEEALAKATAHSHALGKI